jgi:hypothetical protein
METLITIGFGFLVVLLIVTFAVKAWKEPKSW